MFILTSPRIYKTPRNIELCNYQRWNVNEMFLLNPFLAAENDIQVMYSLFKRPLEVLIYFNGLSHLISCWLILTGNKNLAYGFEEHLNDQKRTPVQAKLFKRFSEKKTGQFKLNLGSKYAKLKSIVRLVTCAYRSLQGSPGFSKCTLTNLF